MSNAIFEFEEECEAVCLATIAREPIQHIWKPWLPIGEITLFDGEEGIGKSTLLAKIVAAFSIGSGLPGHEGQVYSGTTLWFSGEDDPARVLRPRLESAGADLKHVFCQERRWSLDESGLLYLEQMVDDYDAHLVIFDPLFAFATGDSNRGHNARRLTSGLRRIAARGVTIILVRHIGKSRGSGEARAAGLGSIEWRAAARSHWMAGCDQEQRENRALFHIKNNFGPMADPCGYRITTDPDSPSNAAFEWTDSTSLRIDQALRSPADIGLRLVAEDFLRDELSDGERSSAEIDKLALEQGISLRTLKRAKTSLKVQARRVGGRDGQWLISLPT